MCVCMRTIFSPYFCAVSLILSAYSNQNPKDDAGPPTFVLFVLPSPALILMPTLLPGAALPYSSSWRKEHALYFTPADTISFRSSGSCCEDRLMCSGGIPANIARFTSYALEASMCRPSELKSLSISLLDAAFIA